MTFENFCLMTCLEDNNIAREGDSILHCNTYCMLIILYYFENFSLMPRLEDSIIARVGDSIIARPSIRIGTPRSNVSNTRPANRTFFFLCLLLYFLSTPFPPHIPVNPTLHLPPSLSQIAGCVCVCVYACFECVYTNTYIATDEGAGLARKD
jgi:hypothetical protein